ncbi:MAG: S8 family peptidase, partial [Candidatus Heimdallarchaeaceae archaeon]
MKRKAIYLLSIVLLSLMLFQTATFGLPVEVNPKNQITTKPKSENVDEPFVDSMRKYVLHFTSDKALQQYVESYNPKYVYPHLKMVIIKDWLSKKQDLQKVPGVDRVFDVTNTKYTYIEPPENPTYIVASKNGVKLTQETADFLNVSFLWGLGYRGDDIVVYDIDSGINLNHVDFQGRILENISKSFISPEYGYKQTDPALDDPIGHGTHTAGIAAGAGIGNPNYIGMAPAAWILVAKLGSPAPPEAFLGAFEYGANLSIVDVINLSWGGTDVEGQDVEELAAKELMLDGMFIAIAAGNSADSMPLGYYSAESPGSSPQAVTVAAVSVSGKKASFSSMGPTADQYVKPDVAAPGLGIMSCGTASSTAYVSMDGTSMATPHITGVTAVLIQALKDLGIPYDTGLLKTALMVSADPKGADYLTLGAGIPNVGEALGLIQNAPTNGTGFPVLLWAIPEFPIPTYETVPQGFHSSFYVESVSSTPYEDLAPVLSGNISSIISLNTTPATGPWAKNYLLTLDVPDDAQIGYYEGYITFETSQGVQAKTHIGIHVVEGKAKILYAKMHTNWKMDYYLGQYILVIKDLMKNGIAVNEYATGELTPELLSEHDALWLFDPVSYDYPELWEGNADYRITAKPFTDAEIQAIQDYIDNGGSMILDFLGLTKTRISELGVSILDGNNITMLNKLIEPFDITIDETPYSFDSPEPAKVVYSHTITEGVGYIDHYGTYLTVGDNALILTKYNNKGTTAIYENENGGRVFVATTNFFLDTSGYIDAYNDKTNNKQFVKNLFNWLLAQEKIIGSYTKTADGATFDLKVVPSTATVT